MKTLFIVFLVLNFLLEAIASITLIGEGVGFFNFPGFEGGLWSMNYGFAAIAVASALFWVWPHRTNSKVVGTVLGILLTFHALISVSFAIQGEQMASVIVHAMMCVLGVFLFSRRSAWCES